MSLQLVNLDVEPSPIAERGDSFDREDPRWKLATQVAESPSFANAPLLSKFLLFVCERSIANRTEELTERNIGVAVFQRRPDFKTSEDNIVRSYVRQLRQRLDRYFEEHESDEPLRIVIPRGGYCAHFEVRIIPSDDPSLAAVSQDKEIAPAATALTFWTFLKPYRILLTAILLTALATAAGMRLWSSHAPAPASPAHPLWAELFGPSFNTYIVSADSGLVVLEEISGKPTTLPQYIDGSYFAQFEKTDTPQDLTLQRLSRERYTGIPDIDTAVALTGLPEANGAHIALRNARSLNLDDMKDANLIFMGSVYSTPWVSLFEPKMNFRYSFDASVYSSSFLNNKPLPGELGSYRNSSTSPPYSTYAVIALLPNLSGPGKVLIIEGLTTAGTEAASDFLLHGEIASFLKTVPRDQHGLRPFELLLKTTSLDSNSSSVEIVTKRIY